MEGKNRHLSPFNCIRVIGRFSRHRRRWADVESSSEATTFYRPKRRNGVLPRTRSNIAFSGPCGAMSQVARYIKRIAVWTLIYKAMAAGSKSAEASPGESCKAHPCALPFELATLAQIRSLRICRAPPWALDTTKPGLAGLCICCVQHGLFL
jgi:hypothetical protein